MPSTVKKEAFVFVWHETGNKTEAYRQAYNAENMTDKTITNKAYILSKKGDIRAMYQKLQDEAREQNTVTVNRLIKEYEKIAFANLSGFVDKDGKPLPPSKLPDELKSVMGVDVRDKLKALSDLGRYMGLFEKDNQQKEEHTFNPAELDKVYAESSKQSEKWDKEIAERKNILGEIANDTSH
jgi:phage terminase small subunit